MFQLLGKPVNDIRRRRLGASFEEDSRVGSAEHSHVSLITEIIKAFLFLTRQWGNFLLVKQRLVGSPTFWGESAINFFLEFGVGHLQEGINIRLIAGRNFLQ